MSGRPAATGGPRLAPAIAPALVAWFRAHARPLPWRRDRDPYRIWLAEVLLQQTRVAQAVPYYERLTARFPDVDRLAAATQSAVLKAWQGAGYYARARNLHAAARTVVGTREGVFPRTASEWRTLPGVGPYIAAAVASLAFGEPVVALEANGLRVAARWALERGDPRTGAVRRALERDITAILPTKSPGAFNEAVMELGETVCRPRAPRCGACPVARWCRARQELRDPGAIPRARRRPPRPHDVAAVVVLEDAGAVFVQRRTTPGLLEGLWEFPGGRIEPRERPPAAARRELFEETGLRAGPLRRVGVVRHAYSHLTVELHVYRARLAGPRGAVHPDRRWVRPRALAALALPKATEKVIALTWPGSAAPSRG